MKFNEKLKQLRKNSKYMQKEIAEKIGVSVITFQQYEKGSREPNIEKLLKIALFFNVSLDELLCIKDYQNSLAEHAEEH